MRHHGYRWARAWQAGLLILAVATASGCRGTHPGAAGSPSAGSGIGAGAAVGQPSASAATNPGGGQPSTCAGPADSCGDTGRIDAITKIIAQTSNSADAFVEFHDASDLRIDGTDRAVQLACDPTACYVEVLCDEGAEPTCESLGGELTPMGYALVQHNYNLDYSPGTAHDFAVRTENLFLRVLGASPGYQLTWKSAAHPSPAPLPTA
jgi:hypothetical protein